MKIQKLTIHNIASIEDAVIDFEAQPLANSEVFLITGKTGAGKSTILDAICLALYADTPRLSGTKMQGDTKDADKTVTIKDPRQIMRRNTGEAYVILTFIGSNSVHYEATWSVSRARKKATGNYQNKSWQLKDVDNKYTFTKDIEIKTEIKKAIGLDFNQFCRTTMLAQGDFTRFLNSEDKEKAEILEKITGVDIYSKIGAKVYAITDSKKKDWENAQQLTEGTHTLKEFEIAQKQETLNTLDIQYKEKKETKEKEEKKRDWIQTESILSKNKNEAILALRIANETVESEEYKNKEKLITDWNATINARQWITESEKSTNELERQKIELNNLQNTYAELLGGHKYAENEVSQYEKEIKQINIYLSEESNKVCVYENTQTIVSQLTIIDDGRKAILESLANIEAENQKLNHELIPAFNKTSTIAKNTKDDFYQEQKRVNTLDESMLALNLPILRAKRENAKDLLNKISTAKERIDTLTKIRTQYNETRKSLEERNNAITEKKAQLDAMNTPIHDAELKMKVCKENLDKQSDTVNKFASTLRLKLKVGEICPVCRQEIKSVFPKEEELAELVMGLKNSYEKAERDYNNLVNAQLKLEAEIKAETKALERDYKAFTKDTSVTDLEVEVVAACKECYIEKFDNTTLSYLDNLELAKSDEFKELDTRINDGEKQEIELNKLRKTLETKRKLVEKLTEQVTEAEKAVSDSKGYITTLQALIDSKKSEIERTEQNVSKLIVGTWQISWNEYPKMFADILTSASKIYNTKVQEKQELERKLETSKTNVENVQDVLANIISIIPLWQNIELKSIRKIDNLLTKVNTLNTNVATTLNQINTIEKCIETNQEQLYSFLIAHQELSLERIKELNHYTSDNIMNVNKLQDEARNEVIAKKTLLANAEQRYNEHYQTKPELAEEETIDNLIERIKILDSQLAEIGEQKGAINQELKADNEKRKHLGNLMKDADNKKIIYQKWSRLDQLIGDSTGSKFRKIAQSYVLTSLIHTANSYMKTLTDRYILTVEPGTFVIAVEDAYQGYALRATSTISGGESFLVSLSLALALSDIGQSLSVDTLFIDEGFGTLSGEPLQNAINTLRTLHTKSGRHVGIISHVDELKERIPIQIQVNQEGNSSSSKISIVS